MSSAEAFELDVTSGWGQVSTNTAVVHGLGFLSIKDASYMRGDDSVTDTSLQIKINFKQVNKLTCLSIVSNARFVEIYTLKDSLLKYMTTMRGVTPEEVFPTSAYPLFECKYTDENCEFRELHLKFLSIKPALVADPVCPLQLSLVSLSCEYSKGTADTAPPLQQGPSLGGMGMGMGMGGPGGVDMMAMMAMSMMGGMPGAKGGMGGMQGIPSIARSNPVRAVPLTAPVAAGNSTKSGNNDSEKTEAGVSNDAAAPSPDISSETVAGPSTSQTTAGETSAPATTATATKPNNPPISSNPPTTTSTTTSSATTSSTNLPSRPAVAPPGLDIAQLASMLWTVKGSMLEEMGQLLDRKLAPVMSRLDQIDCKLRNLEMEVCALQRKDGEDGAENVERESVTVDSP